MKHALLKDKQLKKLRLDIHEQISEDDFIEIAEKFVRLRKQYKLLKFAKKIEKIKIPVIEIPILRWLSKLVDFFHWKIYDLLILIINGKKFNFFGVTCYCGKQGSGKTIGVVREVEQIKKEYPDAIICTNINYTNQDEVLTSWLQLLELRNRH